MSQILVFYVQLYLYKGPKLDELKKYTLSVLDLYLLRETFQLKPRDCVTKYAVLNITISNFTKFEV